MSQHHFILKATWNGGLHGEGMIESGSLSSVISVPKEFNGPGTGTNPEEMLLGSAATCYLITLAAMLERRSIPVASLTLETEGILSKTGGLHFEKIIHRPHIQLASNCTEEQALKAHDLPRRAEDSCMISRAIRGNVEITVESTIT